MRLATLVLMFVAVVLLARIAWVQLDAPPSEAVIQTAIARTAGTMVETIQSLPASQEATTESIFDDINSGLEP